MEQRAGLAGRLGRLAEVLGSVPLHLAGEAAEVERDTVRRLARDYLAPRLAAPRSPLVVAVVGPAGSGKSTLIDSLAGAVVSPAGALRPTTTAPVVWTGDIVPPSLDAVLGSLGGTVVDYAPPPPEGLVLVDTPPPGVTANGRSIAADVLAVADACVVVTTGLRYADAVAWDLIENAAARHLPIVFVLNRAPEGPEEQHTLLADFARRLAAGGHVDRPDTEVIVGVAEGPTGPEGLPAEWITGLRKEMEALGSPESRHRVVRAVTGAALERVRSGLDHIRTALVDAAVTRNELLDPVAAAYRAETEELIAAVSDGGLADLAGEAEGLAADLAAVAARRAGRAARTAASAWESHDEGSGLLAAAPGLWAHGGGAVDDARERFFEWYGSLDAIVAPIAGRWRPTRRRRRMAAWLARLTLDNNAAVPARIGKRLGRVPDAVVVSRERLAAALRETLELDAGRFLAVVGAGPPAGVLGRLTLEERS